MGGMIAQTLAARHPEAVRSLVSIMSNTGSRRSGQPSLRVYPIFLRRRPRGPRGVHRAHGTPVRGDRLAGLPRDDPEDMRAIATASYDRDHDPGGPGRQLAAIIASGDRTAELQGITAPDARHPRQRRPAGRALRRARDRPRDPGSRADDRSTGMGHDLPRAAWPQLIDAIAAHALQRRRPRRRSTRPYRPAPSSRAGRDRSRPSASPGCSLSAPAAGGCTRAGPAPSARAHSRTSSPATARAPASAGRGGSASAGTASGRAAHGASGARDMRTVSSPSEPSVLRLVSPRARPGTHRPVNSLLPLGFVSHSSGLVPLPRHINQVLRRMST